MIVGTEVVPLVFNLAVYSFYDISGQPPQVDRPLVVRQRIGLCIVNDGLTVAFGVFHIVNPGWGIKTGTLVEVEQEVAFSNKVLQDDDNFFIKAFLQITVYAELAVHITGQPFALVQQY